MLPQLGGRPELISRQIACFLRYSFKEFETLLKLGLDFSSFFRVFAHETLKALSILGDQVWIFTPCLVNSLSALNCRDSASARPWVMLSLHAVFSVIFSIVGNLLQASAFIIRCKKDAG